MRTLSLVGSSTLLTALQLASTVVGAPACEACRRPEELVNTLGGTNSTSQLSHGNTLPLVVRPWGMNAWAPDNLGREGAWEETSWWFRPGSRSFAGIRCTHQPSPWLGDYGEFWIVPFTSGTDKELPADLLGGAPYKYFPEASAWKPYYWNASLWQASKPVASLELTSTQRGAVLRVRFRKDCPGRRQIAIVLNSDSAHALQVSKAADGELAVTGMTTQNSGGVPNACKLQGFFQSCGAEKFHHYFHVSLEGSSGDVRSSFSSVQATDKAAVVIMQDGDARADEIIVRVATSFISAAQAEVNHRREVAGRSFDAVLSEAKQDWQSTLGRVEIQDVGEGYTPTEQRGLLEVFYTSLYRAVQFPRLLHEVTEDGRDVHYSPYDSEGRALPGLASTDSGFWDAYRALYPLLSLVYPEQYARLLEGWLTAWRESGWLPKWASPGIRASMHGTLADAVLADAITKRVPGLDFSAAYSAARQDAFKAPVHSKHGREALKKYLSEGFIPKQSYPESLSRSLDYMLADNALAHAAEALGKQQDATLLSSRASAYKLLFDNRTGFFRSPEMTKDMFSGNKTAAFDSHFSAFDWGNDYTEGGPWQYRFSVPWDVEGLTDVYRHAGLDLCNELERMMTARPSFGFYHDYTIIHEQSEMAFNCWGQYAHNNQPVHHVLYMFAASAGNLTGSCAKRGQFWLRKAMLELYKPGPSMFSGDEDNGAMGAWFVLSALGLYQLEPGEPVFTVGSPLFARTSLRRSPGAGGELRIVAESNGKGRPFVQSASWAGIGQQQPQWLKKPEVAYKDLMQGGTLQFTMTGEAGDLQLQTLASTDQLGRSIRGSSGMTTAWMPLHTGGVVLIALASCVIVLRSVVPRPDPDALLSTESSAAE